MKKSFFFGLNESASEVLTEEVMVNESAMITEGVFDLDRGLFESEIAYQNIVMEAMEEEASILMSEEADAEEKQTGAVATFFIKIAQWFKELGIRIAKFVQTAFAKIKNYAIKAKAWLKDFVTKSTPGSLRKKVVINTVNKWKNGVPKATAVGQMALSHDSAEAATKSLESIKGLYVEKRADRTNDVTFDRALAIENINQAPSVIAKLEVIFANVIKAAKANEAEAKAAVNAAKKDGNKNGVGARKELLTEAKMLRSKQSALGSFAIKTVNDILSDALKAVRFNDVPAKEKKEKKEA